MASWERGQKYRGRAVAGQIQIERNATTGTLSAQGMIEVTMGPMLGQRLRWRGYLNSPSNIEIARDELRAMGWRGVKLGDWQGLGSKEIEFAAMGDDAEKDGKSVVYWRAAFVRPLATLNEDKAVSTSELDAINRDLGGHFAVGAARANPPASPSSADPWDRDPAEA